MIAHGTDVVLVMRSGLAIRTDHVDCLSRMGLAIHLVTEDDVGHDPRFATVRTVAHGMRTEDLADEIGDVLATTGSAFAITFLEMDIVAVGLANRRHGVSWAAPDADAIARDKSRQRRHLVQHGIGGPRFLEVRDVEATVARMARGEPSTGPWVVKPTRGASSSHVQLVHDTAEAAAALAGIRALAETRHKNFYDYFPDVWATVEEYVPGEEITCDGIVIAGEFYLGGIHTKSLSPGPWFEEDFYTLPSLAPDQEREVSEIARRITASLGVEHCLFNLELRRDARGALQVIEFSTRISGGHVYRCILDVHAVDLVELFLLSLLGDVEEARARAQRRHPGRMASCIRMIYRTGRVVVNLAGEAAADPAFRAYYPLAGPGSYVAAAPAGFEICGLLSVRGRLDPAHHPAGIHATARRLERLLALDVVEEMPARDLADGYGPARSA